MEITKLEEALKKFKEENPDKTDIKPHELFGKEAPIVQGAVWEYEGEEEIDEPLALAQLLIDGALFTFDTRATSWGKEPKVLDEYLISCAVNCNDIFAWACADAQGFDEDDLPELYRMHMDPKNGNWGSTKWVCKKRNLQPQGPVKKAMKEAGVWEKWMDKLDKNN